MMSPWSLCSYYSDHCLHLQEREERREEEQKSKRVAKEGMEMFMAANTTRPDPTPMKPPSKTVITPVATHIKQRRVKFTKVKVLKRSGQELPTITQKVEKELKGLFRTTPKKTKVVPLGYDNCRRAMDHQGPAHARVAWT